MEPIFKDEWTDIVFESRNKAYGAYQLRQSYHKHMTVAFLICMAPLGSILALSSFSTQLAPKGKTEDPAPHVRPFVDKQIEEELPGSPPPKIKKDGGMLIVVKNDTLLPKLNTDPEPTETTSNTVSQDTSGMANSTGQGLSGAGFGTGTDTTGTGLGITPKLTVIDKDIIVLVPDEKATFNENVQQYFANHFQYPRAATLNSVQGKMRVKFVIETDGSVSNIKFLSKPLGFGLEEEVIRVISSMLAWKPALSKGQKVRSQFSMPLEIKLLD